MMRFLYLAHANIGDRSYGAGMRTNQIHDALRRIGEVHTLFVTHGEALSCARGWDERLVRRIERSEFGWSRRAIKQARTMKSWVAGAISEIKPDVIVARELDLALLIPANMRSRTIMDLDDFKKYPNPGSRISIAARGRLAARNRVARWLSGRMQHVWYCNPMKDQRPSTTRSTLIPNTVAHVDMTRVRANPVPGRVLMVGLLTYAPNWDGLVWFVRHIWSEIAKKVPGAELHTAGRFHPDLAAELPSVVFHGFVDDLASEYDKASIVIAPIRSGSGTQIKIIDALMHGRPVVTSRFAHRGFSDHLRDEVDYLVAETDEQWVEACCQLLTDHEKAEQLAANGQIVVADAYGTERLNKAVVGSIEQVQAQR